MFIIFNKDIEMFEDSIAFAFAIKKISFVVHRDENLLQKSL